MPDMMSPARVPLSRFDGRIALVTGAASGLGRSLCGAFADAGADVVAVDIDEDGLRRTEEIVKGHGSRCLARRVDVSGRSEMEALADEVISEWGGVDILVNNAGVGVGGELKDVPLEDFERIVGVNLLGEVYGTRLFLPQMVARGSGHIVNVASLSGVVVLPLHIPYTTTKFALAGFTEALWIEARMHGIGVTLVCPAGMRTNIMNGARVYAGTRGQERFAERWGEVLYRTGMEPDEAAGRILRAVEKNRFLLLLGREAYLLYYLRRFFPGLARHASAWATAFISRR